MQRSILRIAVFGAALALAAGLANAQIVLEGKTEPSTECPCFSQADVEAIPTPYLQCAIQLSEEKWTLTSNLINVDGHSGAQVNVYTKTEMGSNCQYIDYYDPLDTFVNIEHLSLGQALTCRQYILNVIEANFDQCLSVVEYTWEKP